MTKANGYNQFKDDVMKQDDLIEKIKYTLQQNKDVRGAWLTGSFGRGDADQYSDVDVIVLIEDGRLDTIFSAFQQEINKISPILFSKTLSSSKTINVITPEWQRFDLTFVSKLQLQKMSADHLKALFDRDAAGKALPLSLEVESDLKPADLTNMVNEFLRILGLMPVVIGRKEYIVGQTGSNLLRDMLIKLMIYENASGPVRGALSLSRSLNEEQIEVLNNLPPLSACKDAILTVNKEIAEDFLPRARSMAQKIGAEWPEAFEAVTIEHLKKTLKLEIEF